MDYKVNFFFDSVNNLDDLLCNYLIDIYRDKNINEF